MLTAEHCWLQILLDFMGHLLQPVGLESWTGFRGPMVVMYLYIFSSLCVILIDGHRLVLYIELDSWGIFGLFNNAIFRIPPAR